MQAHITATHKNEDYTVRYLMTEPLDGGGADPALHMFETYVSPILVCHLSFHPNFIFIKLISQQV